MAPDGKQGAAPRPVPSGYIARVNQNLDEVDALTANLSEKMQKIASAI